MIATLATLAAMTASQFSGGPGPYQGPSPLQPPSSRIEVKGPPKIPAVAKLHYKFDGVVLDIKIANQTKQEESHVFQVTPDDPKDVRIKPVWRTFRYKLAPNERLEAVRLVTTRARRWELDDAIYRPHHPTAIWVKYNGSKPVKMRIVEERVPRQMDWRRRAWRRGRSRLSLTRR